MDDHLAVENLLELRAGQVGAGVVLEFVRLYLPPSRVWVACHSIARVSLRTRDMSSISEISGRGRSYPTDPRSRATCSGRVPVRRRSYGPGQAAQCTSHFSPLVLAGLRGDHKQGNGKYNALCKCTMLPTSDVRQIGYGTPNCLKLR